MTKKLKEMLSYVKPKKKRVKKKAKRKLEPPYMLAVHISQKTAMVELAETFKENNKHTLKVYSAAKNPGTQFLLECYTLITEWTEGQLREYIKEMSKVIPSPHASGLLGQVKSIIHDIFRVDDSDMSIDPDTWKMWPNVSEGSRKESKKMADKKAKKKKVASKKKTSNKKEDKKLGKKKVAKKTKAKKKGNKSSTRLSPITHDSMITRKKATCDESSAWNDFLQAMPKKAISFADLCDHMEKELDADEAYTRRVLGSLRRRGLVVATG